MKKLIIVCAATWILSACDQSPKSVEYFKTHQEEMYSVAGKCKWNPSSVDCPAALEADAIINHKLYIK